MKDHPVNKAIFQRLKCYIYWNLKNIDFGNLNCKITKLDGLYCKPEHDIETIKLITNTYKILTLYSKIYKW